MSNAVASQEKRGSDIDFRWIVSILGLIFLVGGLLIIISSAAINYSQEQKEISIPYTKRVEISDLQPFIVGNLPLRSGYYQYKATSPCMELGKGDCTIIASSVRLGPKQVEPGGRVYIDSERAIKARFAVSEADQKRKLPRNEVITFIFTWAP